MRNSLFEKVAQDDWKNWHWQIRNSFRTISDLLRVFPSLANERIERLIEHLERFKFLVTPYSLSNIRLDSRGNPEPADPLWRQLHCETIMYHEFGPIDCGWEKTGELEFGILHQKYPGRAILRITDCCFGYCTYCYRAHRTLEQRGLPQGHLADVWPSILAYLRRHTAIYEVLISGGDPLMLSNTALSKLLRDLRAIPSIRYIRINTRALTYCPSRIDEELARIFAEFKLNALEVHFCHSSEVTDEVDAALDLIGRFGHRPLVLSRAPLLRGVNDTAQDLESLFLSLYARGITPYYLFHFSPDGPARTRLGVPLRKGASLLRALRRRIPGPAFPRYTLFHPTGKHDIPLDANGTNEFVYTKSDTGEPIVSFLNWHGDWATYTDVQSEEGAV